MQKRKKKIKEQNKKEQHKMRQSYIPICNALATANKKGQDKIIQCQNKSQRIARQKATLI